MVQTVLNTGLLLSLGLLPSLDCSTSGLAFLLLGLEACVGVRSLGLLLAVWAV